MIIVYCPFPNLKSAKAVGEKLVRERIARCINILPSNSIYEWKGKIERTKEFVLIAKMKNTNYKKAEQRIKQLHPYTLPAIFSFKVLNVLPAYGKWIDEY